MSYVGLPELCTFRQCIIILAADVFTKFSVHYIFFNPLSHVQPEFSVSSSCDTRLLNVLHFLFMCSGVRVFVVNGVTIGCQFR